MSGRLKLRAVDGDDLAVLGDVLRDARVPIKEMAFDPEARRFMAAFARYRREDGDPLRECTSVLVVDAVRSAHWCGLGPDDIEREHRLLVVADSASEAADPADPDTCEQLPACPDDGGLAVTLYFDDGAAIRLSVERLDCRLVDVDAARPAADLPADRLAAPRGG
jgi:hypothetical protein